MGKTCKRGSKGQYSRAGSSVTPGFEGGQMTYIRRLPKRGFSRVAIEKDIEIINVDTVEKVGVKEVTPALLSERGIIAKRFDRLKVLGNGSITKAVTIHAHAFSEKAKSKIEAAGGTVVVLNDKKVESKAKRA